MHLNVDNVGAERTSSGRLLQATGPATQNARLPSCSLVLGTTKSPRAVEQRAERLGTVETGMHISFRYHGARSCIALYTSRQTLNEMRSLDRLIVTQIPRSVATYQLHLLKRNGMSTI